MIGGWTPSSAGVAVSLCPSILSARQIPKTKQAPHTPPNARILPFYPFLDLLLPSLLASTVLLPLVPAAVAAAYPCETPTSYYSPADGLKGASLKKRLSSIISPHHSISYKKVWDALKILDAADVDNPEDSSQVIEIYSLRSVAKELAGKPEGWNREHLWPRSYGLRDGPSFTDLHNLRPADVNVNSSRGNKYYGECVATSVICLRPANREAAPDTETDKQRWAPPLQVRGDVARSIMYMAVCYGFHQPDGSPYLKLSDSPQVENREMGLLSALLQWNELDPPSRAEQLRNDRICRQYQHNRNPFVDHPEYANLIWKHDSQSSMMEKSHYNEGKDENEEQLRNNRICRQCQHNRNLFVDHPEYANLIWKHDRQSSMMEKSHYNNEGKDELRNDRICRQYQYNRNPFVDHSEYANLIWKHDSQSSMMKKSHYNNENKDENEMCSYNLLSPHHKYMVYKLGFVHTPKGGLFRRVL